MTTNFLETVRNYFNEEFTHQAANSLDESSSGISKALSAIIPTGLAVVLRKATSGNEEANDVFNMATEASGYFPQSPNLSDLHNDERGSDLPSQILGDNQSAIENGVSRFAGIKNSSAASLMTLALPVIMGLLGKHSRQNTLSASGIAGFLSSQRNEILHSLPPGFSSLAGMPEMSSPGIPPASINSNTKTDLSDQLETVEKKPFWRNKWWILIIIIAVIVLLIYFSKGCNNTMENTAFTSGHHQNISLLSSSLFPANTHLQN